jgi:hypothetical protein
VADAGAIDALAAALPGSATLLRFAPDEAIVLGLGGDGRGHLDVDDPHAIVEPETGFVSVTVGLDTVRGHTEWAVPDAVGAVAQGAIAGVPAKLVRNPNGEAMVVVHAAYIDDLLDRLR